MTLANGSVYPADLRRVRSLRLEGRGTTLRTSMVTYCPVRPHGAPATGRGITVWSAWMSDARPADLFSGYVLDVRVQVEAQLRQLTEIQQHMETWRAADDDGERAALADLVERSVQQLVASNITIKQSLGEAAGLISTCGRPRSAESSVQPPHKSSSAECRRGRTPPACRVLHPVAPATCGEAFFPLILGT